MSGNTHSEFLCEAIELANKDADLVALISETDFIQLKKDDVIGSVTLLNGKCPFCKGGYLEVWEQKELPSVYFCLSANCSQARPGFAVDYLVAMEGMSEAEAVARLQARKAKQAT